MSGPERSEPQDALKGVPIVNLVIDTGDWSEDERKKHTQAECAAQDRFIKGVRETADRLREQGIPTVWIAIKDQNVIHDKWDAATVAKLDMNGLNPQAGDVLFEKRFMSGFTTLEQLEEKPALKTYIMGQRPTDGANYTEAFAQDLNATLTDLLKDAKHVIINGGMGQFCVTDNSIDATLQGKGVTVLKENIAVWKRMSPPWNSENISTGDPDFNARQVETMLNELKANPALRALPEDAPAKIDTIKISDTGEFLRNLPALRDELGIPQPATLPGSKFAGAAKDDAVSPAKISAAPAVRQQGMKL